MRLIRQPFILISLLLLCISAKAQNTITVYDENLGLNEVIDIPENMMTEVDSLMSEWFSKTYLDKDEECQSKDENPVFPTEVYINRLQRLPNIIEMPHNEVVQKFIDMYSGQLRRSVSYMLAASNFYTPIFEEALEACGIPLELKYLPIIESALNPKAVSRAGAVGLWQFMITTSKGYDLEVNSLVDDRKDPIKSSYAAARYLKDLYNIFGDWTMKFPNLSERFDAEDIRKLREYNSLRHSKMSHKEILDDIRQGAESFMSEFSCCVAEKQATYDASKKK